VGYKKTDWTVVTITEDQEEPVHVELAPVVQTFSSTIYGRMVNLNPGYREVLVYAVSGTREIPHQASKEYWQEIHRVRRSDRAVESDTFIITGLDPGDYTVIAFQFSVRHSREAREAAGMSIDEFYALTRLASVEVFIGGENEEIEVELSF
jgi:hypothetical protein